VHPIAPAIRVIHDDDWILVIDKPSGIPSVPALSPFDPPSVCEQLADAWGPLEAAHRLDRDTSGLLILARTTLARRQLGLQFESRLVRKRYRAIVHGVPRCAGGTLHLPLARDFDRPPRWRVDPILGVRAVTRWNVISPATGFATSNQSVIELEPLTGRSHQLRIHLAWMGLPIIGDQLYGPVDHAHRLHLHAEWLAIAHPQDGRPVEFFSHPIFEMQSSTGAKALPELLPLF